MRPSWEEIFDDAFTYSQILSIMKSKFYDSIYIHFPAQQCNENEWSHRCMTQHCQKCNEIKWFFINKAQRFFKREKIFLEKFAMIESLQIEKFNSHKVIYLEFYYENLFFICFTWKGNFCKKSWKIIKRGGEHKEEKVTLTA